jgi:uncharacterized protein (DUF952 family)
MTNRLFHITSRQEWDASVPAGEYLPADFAREGFIHCSYGRQVEKTAAKHFAGRTGLVLLEINRDAVHSRIVDENLSGGTEPFPHIYGPLPVKAVIAIYPFSGTLPA